MGLTDAGITLEADLAPRPGPRIEDLRRKAAPLGCEVITRRGLNDLVRARAYESQKRSELQDEVRRLRAALEHEPWWRRRRA